MINCFFESDSPVFSSPHNWPLGMACMPEIAYFSGLLVLACERACVCEKYRKSALPFYGYSEGFVILSSQMFNNSYFYIGGYLTHDRQTVCSSLSGV